MTKKQKTTTESISFKEKLAHVTRVVHRYIIVVFLLFLVGIYGFLAWRVISLNQTEPNAADVSAQLKTASVPHIDTDVVNKIQQLQDNSVSAQSLFDQARQNPFQE